MNPQQLYSGLVIDANFRQELDAYDALKEADAHSKSTTNPNTDKDSSTEDEPTFAQHHRHKM